MMEQEKKAAKCLLKKEWPALFAKEKKRKRDNNGEQDEDNHDPSSPIQFLRALQQQEEQNDSMQSLYLTNLKRIQPTTCAVEHLFSICRYILTYDRRRMLPRIFEAIIFLKMNKEFWYENAQSLIHEMVAGGWDVRLGKEYDSDDESDVGEDYQQIVVLHVTCTCVLCCVGKYVRNTQLIELWYAIRCEC